MSAPGELVLLLGLDNTLLDNAHIEADPSISIMIYPPCSTLSRPGMRNRRHYEGYPTTA